MYQRRMNSESLADHHMQQHVRMLVEFTEALSELFPACGETKDAVLYTKNVIANDRKLMRDCVKTWCDNLKEPLKRGCAKYIKAIESITQETACVYHALKYRDASAIDQSTSSETMRRLDLYTKLQSMDDEARATYWKYMDELSRTAFEATRTEAPRVPSREEIQRDIDRRRRAHNEACALVAGGGTEEDASESQSVARGALEAWKKLCASREITSSASEESVLLRLSQIEAPVAERCRSRNLAAFRSVIQQVCPESADTDQAPSDNDWSNLNTALGLATMRSTIPAPMMSGIEHVANQLMRDMSSGKTDMSQLDVEAIGQRVLANVRPDDMSAFASNIDKILPALSHLRPD